MSTNHTNMNSHLIYPELSYRITGVLFQVHNTLGRFAKEAIYANAIEQILLAEHIPFIQEPVLHVDSVISKDLGLFRPDFIIADVIVSEIKAKQVITKEDYAQLLRYLRFTNKKPGLLVNFRNKFLKAKRIAN